MTGKSDGMEKMNMEAVVAQRSNVWIPRKPKVVTTSRAMKGDEFNEPAGANFSTFSLGFPQEHTHSFGS